MKEETTKLISLRCPLDLIPVIEQHMLSNGLGNRTDAIVDLIRRGSGQKLPVSSVFRKDSSVIQPVDEDEYVSKTDLQELESDLYARLVDQLNELLNQRLAPLERSTSQLEQERDALLGEPAA